LQINAGDSTMLTATGGGSYVWSTGDSTAAITVSPTTTTNYSVIVFDPNGCPDTVAVTVVVEENCARSVEQISVPNVFSPNADGVNDLFEITYDAECIRGIRVEVWDRWGIQVYSGEQDVPDWDGRFRNDNKYVTDGVYYYVIRGNTATNEPFERNGFVHVLRPLD
jgi:gliding motility-associated-like protein